MLISNPALVTRTDGGSTMKPAIVKALCAATITLMAGCGGTGEKEEQEPLLDLTQFDSDAGEKCIPLAGIKSTNIIGNQAIEFRMRSGVTYINVLRHDFPPVQHNLEQAHAEYGADDSLVR